MNLLKGSIVNIKQVDSLISLEIEVGTKIFTSLVIANEKEDQYKIGESVNVIFKETEVMIATHNSKVSARNAFISPIISIEKGELLCSVSFAFDSFTISSIITKSALFELFCEVGKEYLWFIKSNEVSIQKIDDNKGE